MAVEGRGGTSHVINHTYVCFALIPGYNLPCWSWSHYVIVSDLPRNTSLIGYLEIEISDDFSSNGFHIVYKQCYESSN